MKSSQVILLVIFTILIFITPLLSSRAMIDINKSIIDVYEWDYELINRTVILLSERPEYSIDQRVDDNRIVVSFDRTVKSPELPVLKSVSGKVVKSIEIREQRNGQTIVEIETHGTYHLRHFHLPGERHRIVFDIYKKRSPITPQEKMVFGRFYYSVRFLKSAERQFTDLVNNHPEITSANYFMGLIQQKRGQKEQAISSFQKVKMSDPEYVRAQEALLKLGFVKIPVSSELEKALEEFKDFFYKADDINRVNYMLYLLSAAQGNTDRAKSFLLRINQRDLNVQTMKRNLTEINYVLSSDPNLKPLIPESVSAGIDAGEVKDSHFPWLIFILVIIATAIATFIIAKKTITPDRFPEDFDHKDISVAANVEAIVPKEIEKRVIDDPPKNTKLVESMQIKEETAIDKPEKPVNPVKALKPEKPKKIMMSNMMAEKPKKSTDTFTEKESDSVNPESISSGDLKKELARKLYLDGWFPAAISKELDTPIERINEYLHDIIEKTD